jgi:precorrin-6A/cobalt-precorrin-6A reductase
VAATPRLAGLPRTLPAATPGDVGPGASPDLPASINRGRVLVLGGSAEARALAVRLSALAATDVTVSLAGHTAVPSATPDSVTVRIGGFGGPQGLADHLVGHGVDAVIDATHPFAATMSGHAYQACTAAGVPRLRLLRRGWAPVPGDDWRVVPDLAAAADAVAASGARRVFLALGGRHLAPFASVSAVWFLVRMVQRPEDAPLPHAEVVVDRGPFDEAGEATLLSAHAIDLVVARDSGGAATSAKLAAARRLRLPVVVVARPPAPPGPEVATVEAAVGWYASVVGERASGRHR